MTKLWKEYFKLVKARKKFIKAGKWLHEYEFGRKPRATVGEFNRHNKDCDDALAEIREICKVLSDAGVLEDKDAV